MTILNALLLALGRWTGTSDDHPRQIGINYESASRHNGSLTDNLLEIGDHTWRYPQQFHTPLSAVQVVRGGFSAG